MEVHGTALGACSDCEGFGSPLVLTGSVRPCVVRRGVFRRFTGETYVPTKQSSSCEEARLSRPHGYGRRPSCAQGSSGQGPRQAERVTTVAAGRLIGRSSFAALNAQGVRVRSSVLSARVLATANPPRVGFALPTSLGNAVVRNRIRRQLRAALSLSLLPQSSVDVVIRPSNKAIGLDYHQLVADLQLLLLRVDQLAVPAMKSDSFEQASSAQASSGSVPERPPLGARPLLLGIALYQAFRRGRPSPCRFEPSCSVYGAEALTRFGAMRGSWLTIRRIGRCRPGGGFGLDPVPPRQ